MDETGNSANNEIEAVNNVPVTESKPPPSLSFVSPVIISLQNEPPPPAYTSYDQFVPPPAGYHQAGFSKVNRVQPQPVPNNMMFAPNQGANVNDFMIWSVVNCLCCLWPVGLIAIILSCVVMQKKKDNNMESAKSLSKATAVVNGIATVGGIGFIIYIIISVTQMLRSSVY
ncbi:unnamed protein product [Adineta steineri]|uniref:Uncharacterized protein n=1 Tax=Adineta steineri TaxID=433720 RepID=A0A814SMM4_9BILA|nr:unnamed protein product [Adineta steineri]CAF1318743.1 unnamed protein product [Adineta steineri]